MLTWRYERVSTDNQNLDRQIKILAEYGIDELYIIADKASGKKFDRKSYNYLSDK